MTKEYTLDELMDLRFEMMSAAYSDSGSVYAVATEAYFDAVEMSQFSNKQVIDAFYS